MNARRFNGRNDGCLATFSTFFCCCVWFLGTSVGSAIAADNGRVTGAQAVQRLQQVLGDPKAFEDNMRNSTQDFITDHFGSMAIAAAFGIAIRMRS